MMQGRCRAESTHDIPSHEAEILAALGSVAVLAEWLVAGGQKGRGGACICGACGVYMLYLYSIYPYAIYIID